MRFPLRISNIRFLTRSLHVKYDVTLKKSVPLRLEKIETPQVIEDKPAEKQVEREPVHDLNKPYLDVFHFSSPPKHHNEGQLIDEEDELYRGIDILLTAHSPQILDSFGKFIELVVQEMAELGVEFDGYTTPRLHKDTWVTNKAPFKYGRHKVEYEIRTYKKVCHLLYLTGTTRKLLLNYVERNVPAGVGIEVKSFKLAKFPEVIEKKIEAGLEELTPDELSKRNYFLEMDSNDFRKLKRDSFETRRRPWNPNKRDKEKEEITKFRRQFRREATWGKL